jgi:hypothetical protein
MRTLAVLGLLVAVLAPGQLGCSGAATTLQSAQPGEALDYGDNLQAWTRTDRLYQDFETRVVVGATYYSPRFVEAWLQEHARLYQPVASESEALRSRLEHRGIRNECFFLSVFTGERDWNDFALANSIGRVYLENDRGVRLKARSVQPLEPQEALHRHFFPYHADFHEAYLVCFDRYPQEAGEAAGLPRPVIEPGIGRFSLAFRSPVGNLDLTWELEP